MTNGNQSIDIAKLQRFENLELLANQIVEGFIVGLHKSPFHGFSVEFSEHRLYNPGESTRHIDWKVFGRTDRLYIKKYEEETNLRCILALDTSSSMYYPDDRDMNKMDFSVYAAAAIVNMLKRQRDASGLCLFSDKIEEFLPAKSSNVHLRLLFSQLERQLKREDKNKQTKAAEALHLLAEAAHKRSLIVLFSDMMDDPEHADELFSALQHLKYNKHEVVLFHVMDKEKELDFDFKNRPYRFVDVETGEEVKAYPSEVKDAYLKKIGSYRKELGLKCAQYSIDYIEADIAKGFDPILEAYLIKRSRMK